MTNCLAQHSEQVSGASHSPESVKLTGHLGVSNVELQYASELLLKIVELHLQHCELVQSVLPAGKNLAWMSITLVTVQAYMVITALISKRE